MLRAGIGLYYNDLAQNGWVGALQAVTFKAVGPGGADIYQLRFEKGSLGLQTLADTRRKSR